MLIRWSILKDCWLGLASGYAIADETHPVNLKNSCSNRVGTESSRILSQTKEIKSNLKKSCSFFFA